jgi:hypothetical protein
MMTVMYASTDDGSQDLTGFGAVPEAFLVFFSPGRWQFDVGLCSDGCVAWRGGGRQVVQPNAAPARGSRRRRSRKYDKAAGYDSLQSQCIPFALFFIFMVQHSEHTAIKMSGRARRLIDKILTKSTLQAHQFCVAFALEGVGQRYSAEVSLLVEILKEASTQDGAIDPGEATVSRMQSDVAASIRGLGLQVLFAPISLLSSLSVSLPLSLSLSLSPFSFLSSLPYLSPLEKPLSVSVSE